MVLKQSIKEDMEREYKKVRESHLLFLGIITGIIVSLIAGVINDLIKPLTFYPLGYLFILIFIFFILIFIIFIPIWNWKVFQYKLNKRFKELKGCREMINNYYQKYPKKGTNN